MARRARRIRGLVGDVGGTHARFAIAEVAGGEVSLDEPVTLQAADYRDGRAALKAYLRDLQFEAPKLAVIAAAGPVERGAVAFTNNPSWRFSERRLRAAGGFDQARVINDFTAQALAIAQLKPSDSQAIGPAGARPKRGTAVILGPGTGFGMAARVNDGRSVAIASGEGGHVGFSPEDELEAEIARRLAQRFGRVSIERLLSGPGLLNLYQALAEIRGQPALEGEPSAITRKALAGESLCREGLERFCAILGAVAGDFALAFGAVAGVYVSGGIAPEIFPVLAKSDFRRRFEAKGRLSGYVRAIPTRVVVRPHTALIGAASLLENLEP